MGKYSYSYSLLIEKGDKVLVPSLTFVAVANAVAYTGAEPVFVDSHPKYWCIDPSETEEKIDDRTKAIIVVHLYGHPCDMDEIMRIASKHKLHIIEDCAEAHGAEYKGIKVGTKGTISCYSFYGNKIITTGEGGMCLTNSEDLADKMRILRDHGMNPSKRYWHDIVGFNYRMTNLQAALGVAQMKKIDFLVKRKREIANTYRELLMELPGIVLAPEMPWAKNVYWLYSILIDKRSYGLDRDELMSKLSERGIETRRFFYPVHVMPPYKTCSHKGYPVAESLSSRGINLPSSVKLSEHAIHEIAYLIKSRCKSS